MEMSSLARCRAQENIRTGVAITPVSPLRSTRWGAPGPQAAPTGVDGRAWSWSHGQQSGTTAPCAGQGKTAPESHPHPARQSRAGERHTGKLTSPREPHSVSPLGTDRQSATSLLPSAHSRVRMGWLSTDRRRTAATQVRSRVHSPQRTGHSTFAKRFTTGNPEQAVTNPGHIRQFHTRPKRAAVFAARTRSGRELSFPERELDRMFPLRSSWRGTVKHHDGWGFQWGVEVRFGLLQKPAGSSLALLAVCPSGCWFRRADSWN